MHILNRRSAVYGPADRMSRGDISQGHAVYPDTAGLDWCATSQDL